MFWLAGGDQPVCAIARSPLRAQPSHQRQWQTSRCQRQSHQQQLQSFYPLPLYPKFRLVRPSTSDSPCNWNQTNHVHSHGIAREENGCTRMGRFAGPHVNTTLVILISALCADARLLKALPTPTKRQAREHAARSALRSMRGGGFARDQRNRLPWRRSIPRRIS
jgi:hypothetical protein